MARRTGRSAALGITAALMLLGAGTASATASATARSGHLYGQYGSQGYCVSEGNAGVAFGSWSAYSCDPTFAGVWDLYVYY